MAAGAFFPGGETEGQNTPVRPQEQAPAELARTGLSQGRTAGGDTLLFRWNLEECLRYAMENNIVLKQKNINATGAAIEVSDAKAALFPNLSFSAGQNYYGKITGP